MYKQEVCARCKTGLGFGALVCPVCHTLVHAEELEQLAAAAQMLEEHGKPGEALEKWHAALAKLPEGTSQSGWIAKRVKVLEAAAAAAPVHAGDSPGAEWVGRIAWLAPIVLLLAKGKSLLNMKFVFSLGAFLWVYWTLYGPAFGAGFAVQILVHEMGHYIDIKRRGLPAEMPVFLPGLGAYVKWQALGVTKETRAAVSLAGPLAGFLAAAVCAAIWWKTESGIWAALAHAGAWLNVINLIPVWVLDGGQAIRAMNKAERIFLVVLCVVLWAVLGQNVFFLVAAGAGWRVFTKDLPAEGSPRTAAYFAAVLVALGLLMRVLPVTTFGKV